MDAACETNVAEVVTNIGALFERFNGFEIIASLSVLFLLVMRLSTSIFCSLSVIFAVF